MLTKRIASTFGVILLVFGSLLTFPAYLPWMAATWLLLSLLALANKRPIWPWLVGFVLIIALKRPGYSLEFWTLSIPCGLVAISDWRATRRKPAVYDSQSLVIIMLVLIVATTSYGLIRWFAANTSRRYTLDDRPIACLGDSLTASGYPQELAKLITVPVVDFGVNGIKTIDGIKMIPEIMAADPQLVVIELGGHDYNAEKKPRSATSSNLETLIEAFLEQDIAVVLVEIPRGFISDPYDGLERELAAKHDLQLIDDSVIRSFVFYSPIIPPGMWLDPSKRYSDDGLHPNESGNQHFARVVRRSLARIFGDSILE